MTGAYRIRIRVESYEYTGEFYLVGDLYHSAANIFKHVVAEHMQAIGRPRHIEQYLLDVLTEGENVSKTEYEAANVEFEFEIYADVYYERFTVRTVDRRFEIDGPPTAIEIDSIAVELSSETR